MEVNIIIIINTRNLFDVASACMRTTAPVLGAKYVYGFGRIWRIMDHLLT